MMRAPKGVLHMAGTGTQLCAQVFANISISAIGPLGNIIRIATFPGIMVHEWTHKLFCNLYGVKVYKVAYLKPASLLSFRNDPLGYVIHAEPNTFWQTFFISTAPLIVNSLLAVLVGSWANQMADSALSRIMLYWLAISVGAHAFPSERDAMNVLQRSQRHIANNESPFHYLSYVLFGFIWLLNRLRHWWIDIAYGIILASISS